MPAVTDNKTTAPASKKAKAKTPRFAPLPADRAAWVAANARPAVAPCLCGCNGTTKGRFMPGHDAVLKATLEQTAKTGDAKAKKAATTALATFGW